MQVSIVQGWYKSTYFSKSRKHNNGGDSSQHTFGWSNSVIPLCDTSQHTSQNQENTIMVVIQVNILLDEAIQWCPWVIQVNILFRIKKRLLCLWYQYQWKTIMVVIQVSKLLDGAIQWYPCVIQVNILLKRKHYNGGDSSQHTYGWKHNYVGDSSQHVFILPSGDASQYTWET